jgi:cell division protein FtsB
MKVKVRFDRIDGNFSRSAYLWAMKVNVRIFTSKRVLGLTTTQIIILLGLIVMLFFLSDSSVTKRIQYEIQIKNLESQIEFYRKQTETDKKKLNELQSNKDDLEKFARENYLMKKENEDIFIID